MSLLHSSRLWQGCGSLALFLALGISGAAPASSATIYSTGFESGSLDPQWSTQSSGPDGRIQVWTAFTGGSFGDAIPHGGTYFLGLDNFPGGTYVVNEAWLNLDLSGHSNVVLDFWWMEWNDETEAQDGVYLSDDGGLTFVKVLDLPGASYTDLTWTNFVLDIDSLSSSNGLALTPNFVIKFQQYDNYYFNGGNDGFFFDDLQVTANPSAVPEPGTFWLLGGAAALFAVVRRKRS